MKTVSQEQTAEQGKDDGGPAFPVTSGENDGASLSRDFDGISIRDYFAAKAMQAMCPSIHVSSARDNGSAIEAFQMVATIAYGQADEMLAARKAGAK